MAPKWHAASSAVVETQVIAVETHVVFVEIQIKINLLFSKFECITTELIRN